MTLIYALAGGIGYAGMYAYIAGSPFVFMQKFGFSTQAYGWAFAFNACGLIIGSQMNRMALRKFSGVKITLWTAFLLVFVGTTLLATTLASIATAELTLCLTFLFMFSLGFINPNTTALALKPFTRAAGRESAVLGSIQMIARVVASWLVSFFNNGTTSIMPAVMFGCAVLASGLIIYLHR